MTFKIPYAFGESGDLNSVPDTSTGTELSFQQGWSQAYELAKDQAGYRELDRAQHNFLWNVVTGNIKQWQEQAYPSWFADVEYPIGAKVRRNNKNYNKQTNNDGAGSEPGLSADWVVVNELQSQNDIVGGSIFKGSNGETVEVGDFIEAGTTHIRILIGGNPVILVAWDNLTLPATVTNIPVSDNGFAGYDIETDQGVFEFVTQSIKELRGENGFPTVNKESWVEGWGAKGDEINDDFNSITKAHASARVLNFDQTKTYATSSELNFDIDKRIIRGNNCTIKYIGPTPITPPDKAGGTSVIKISPTNVETGTLSRYMASDFIIDLNGVKNMIGVSCIRATSQSKVSNFQVTNINQHSFGFYFSKEWYADFSRLSSRPLSGLPTQPVGSVGFYLSSSVDQINGAEFSIQALALETGVVLDTTDSYFYLLRLNGYIERCKKGIKHVAGLGIRTANMQIYFENNDEDIDWGDTDAGSDTTAQITWSQCSFNAASSKVVIDEGTHYFVGCDRINEIECNGGEVFVDGNPGLIKSGVAANRITHTVQPSYTRQNARYGTVRSSLKASEQVTAANIPSGNQQRTFPIPADLVRNDRADGTVIEFTAIGRRNYDDASAMQYYKGLYVRRGDNNTWSIEPLIDKTSAEFAVSAGTEEIVIDYNSTGTKYITVEFNPL